MSSSPRESTPDATQVVGPVVQRLMARRLGVAGITLALAFALALVEWALVELDGATHATMLLGPLLSAPVLLALGMRGVRRAFGDPVRPWMSLASASVWIPWAFGVWLLTWRSLRGLAVSGGPGWGWLLLLTWGVLGFRLLRDTARVAEVQRLAATMVLPSPEEVARGQ